MIDDKCCKLQIWDTAGQERFRTITKGESRSAQRRRLRTDVYSVQTRAPSG